MQSQPAPDAEATVPDAALPPPRQGLLGELGQFGRAAAQLFKAQWQLLQAELGLARRAMAWLVAIGCAATLFLNAALLVAVALVAVALAQWFHSWIWSLAAVLVLLLLMVGACAWFCRRCVRWMSLPVTRSQCSAIIADIKGEVRRHGDGEST